MRTLLGILLVCMLWAASLRGQSHARRKPRDVAPRLLIAECAEDGFEVLIPDNPRREKIARFGRFDVEAMFSTDDPGARFWFVRNGKPLLSLVASDLANPGVWATADRDWSNAGPHREIHVALTYSDGGAIGAFHVRVVTVGEDRATDVSKCIDKAVADFRSRHYCKIRGNNVTALKWTPSGLLLITEVYPTGDCGSDLGHAEGYVVSVPDGDIVEHLTLAQLKRYPGICLQRDDGN